MEGRREPFKSKDNNRILCKKEDKKKRSLFQCSKLSVTTAAVINSITRKVAVSEIPAIVSSSGPSLLDKWREGLTSTLLELDMHVEEDYAVDIFSNMMRNQRKYTFRTADIPKSVTSEMRTVLVDWLVQVHEYLGLLDETLYLAVYLLNSYMKVHKIHIHLLQLLAATCLFIACKMEERLIPEPSELCFMMEDAFTKKELMKMEKKVLNRLSFELHYTQPLSFLRLLVVTGKLPEQVRYLAMYFMELTLLEADGAMIEPALLAFGALTLAQAVLLESGCLTPDQMSQGLLYSYSDAELSSPQQLMAKAALRSNPECRAASQKYSRPLRLGVSTGPAMANSKHLARMARSTFQLSPCQMSDQPVPAIRSVR
ncbi:cyclin-P [Gastrophryne carolinensis]